MKTAIVHEWFVNYMGSEKCVESFTSIYPKAEIFALVDYLKEEHRKKILNGKNVSTSFIQKLPFAEKHHRNYLALFPLAVEQFDLSPFDVVLSSSHAVAKGALTNSKQLHICYCHTPIRYAWDLYHQYIREANLERGLKGWIAKKILHYIRLWDAGTANRVDFYIANSNHVAKRIRKIYGRDADVIYPPVDICRFPLVHDKENYYLTASRFVPYKKIDLIVESFSQMPEKKLLVMGSGPDKEKIKALAAPNVEFLGYQSDENFAKYMQKAKAFVFAAEEDFGITIVEAQAAGTPVIAYTVGGASETVIPGKTGILFEQQTCESLISAVNEFEKYKGDFDPAEISSHAQKFDREIFETNIRNFVDQKYREFFGKDV